MHWIPSNFASGTIPTNMECTFFCVFSTTIGCFFPLQYYVSTLLCHLATSLTSCGRSRAGNFLPGPGRRSPAVNSTHIKIASSPHLLNHHHHNFQCHFLHGRWSKFPVTESPLHNVYIVQSCTPVSKIATVRHWGIFCSPGRIHWGIIMPQYTLQVVDTGAHICPRS